MRHRVVTALKLYVGAGARDTRRRGGRDAALPPLILMLRLM